MGKCTHNDPTRRDLGETRLQYVGAAGHSFVVVSDTLVNITAQWVSGRRPHLGRDLFHPHTIVVRFVVVKASCDQCESETSDIIFVRILIEEATVGHVGPHGFKRHLALLLYRVKSVFDAIRHRLFDLFV